MMRFIIRTYAIDTFILINLQKKTDILLFNSFLSNFFFMFFVFYFCVFIIRPHSVHALHATRTLNITSSFFSSSFFSLSCQIVLKNNLIRAGSRL